MATQKIPGRAIKLGTDTAGDVTYFNGTAWVRLAIGEAGHVLTMNDAGTFPQWGSADWIYRGSIRGFSSGGANHHDQPGGGGTGVWYFFSEIFSHEFASDGDAVDTTGDLVTARHAMIGYSSETHSFVSGGRGGNNAFDIDTIESFPNTNPGANATDLANLVDADSHGTPVSSLTHGYAATTAGATIEKFAFTNTVNATLVGNLPNDHDAMDGAGVTDSTADYGYVAGGGAPLVNHISRFSFDNETTTDDVGDLATLSQHAAGCSSETHGYFTGITTQTDPSRVQKYAFASSGNATQVATLSVSGSGRGNGISSMTHGYLVGGFPATAIDKFSFANETTWNHVGDLGTDVTTLRAHHASSHF